MNDVATRMEAATDAASTELTLLANTETPLAILGSAEKFDAFYERVKAEVEGHVPDLTTEKGRKAIASLAFKVVKTKTALDEAGKKLTEDKRREIAAVDAARKSIRDKLDALRDEVRRPLDEWQTAQEERIARCQKALAWLKEVSVIRFDDTSEGVAGRLAAVEALEVSEAEFVTTFQFATDAKASAVAALTAGRDRLAQEEADRVELARLRQEQEERAAREAEEAAAREQAEREATEARQREQEEQARAEAAAQAAQEAAEREARKATERAAAAQRAVEEAAAQARREAEAQAREEAETQARAAREELARQHQAQLDEERRQREAESERAAAAEAEARRLAAERQADEQRAAEERRAAEARAADQAHRGGIMRAAKEALMEHAELDEATAKAVVLVIAAKSIPAVTIQF